MDQAMSKSAVSIQESDNTINVAKTSVLRPRSSSSFLPSSRRPLAARSQSISDKTKSLVQPKLKIGSPNDKYEQEADRVADLVMQMPGIQIPGNSGVDSDQQEGVRTKSLATQITPVIQRQVDSENEEEEEEEEETVQTKKSPGQTPEVTPEITADIQALQGKGQPLPASTQAFFEPRFGYDLSQVRVCTDTQAAHSAQVMHASAYTIGRNIIFNTGQYQPHTSTGQKLLAHELTHFIQQSGIRGKISSHQTVIMRQSKDPKQRGIELINQWKQGIKTADYPLAVKALKEITDLWQGDQASMKFLLREASIATLQTLVHLEEAAKTLGEDYVVVHQAIMDERATRNPSKAQAAAGEIYTIKRGTLLLYGQNGQTKDFFPLKCKAGTQQGCPIPNHSRITVVRSIRGGSWLLIQFKNEALSREWNGKGGLVQVFIKKSDLVEDQKPPPKPAEPKTLTRVDAPEEKKEEPTEVAAPKDEPGFFDSLIDKIPTEYLRSKARAAINYVKQKLTQIPGYTLLTVIIKRDPVTGRGVAQNATNLVGGFLEFVPGGKEKFEKLKESKAIENAFTWLSKRIADLELSIDAIKILLKKAWDSISTSDFLSPETMYNKLKAVFEPPFTRIKNFAIDVGMKVVEFIFEGFMKLAGPLADKVMGVIRKAGNVLGTIVNDPIGFAKHLVSAVQKGVVQFKDKILEHLKGALLGWLFGSMDITIPKTFSFRSILSLILQILGITIANFRTKLEAKLGAPAVQKLLTMFDFLKTLITEGVAAAWEKIKEYATDLVDNVVASIRNMVVGEIVKKGIEKLVTMMAGPWGAVIEAIKTTYNLIKTLYERINEIADFVKSIFDSIGNIANGKIADAANYIETSMAKGLKTLLVFLAGLAGLGGIPKKIKSVIQSVRKPIDAAITKLVDFIVNKGRQLLGAGKQAAKAGIAKLKSWLFPSKTFQAGGDSHTLFVGERDNKPALMIKSTPTPILDFLDTYETKHSATLPQAKKDKIQEARTYIQNNITPLITKIQRTSEQNKDKPQAEVEQLVLPSRQQLLEKEVALSGILQSILGSSTALKNALEKYKLEGLTGTYKTRLKTPYDDITPDHQPQAAILIYAAAQDFFKDSEGQKIRERASGKHADGGFAINLQTTRHKEGRTYGPKGNTTKKAFSDKVTKEIASLSDDQKKRDKVVDLMKDELKEDVKAIKSVVNVEKNWDDINKLSIPDPDKKKLISETKQQILSGEDTIAAQDMESLKGR